MRIITVSSQGCEDWLSAGRAQQRLLHNTNPVSINCYFLSIALKGNKGRFKNKGPFNLYLKCPKAFIPFLGSDLEKRVLPFSDKTGIPFPEFTHHPLGFHLHRLDPASLGLDFGRGLVGHLASLCSLLFQCHSLLLKLAFPKYFSIKHSYWVPIIR